MRVGPERARGGSGAGVSVDEAYADVTSLVTTNDTEQVSLDTRPVYLNPQLGYLCTPRLCTHIPRLRSFLLRLLSPGLIG